MQFMKMFQKRWQMFWQTFWSVINLQNPHQISMCKSYKNGHYFCDLVFELIGFIFVWQMIEIFQIAANMLKINCFHFPRLCWVEKLSICHSMKHSQMERERDSKRVSECSFLFLRFWNCMYDGREGWLYCNCPMFLQCLKDYFEERSRISFCCLLLFCKSSLICGTFCFLYW